MATVETHDLRDPTTRAREQERQLLQPREEERSAEFVTGGSAVESIGGIATVVLAIVGLAGVFPIYLAAVAAIVLGAALLIQGAAIAARFSALVAETAGTRSASRQLGGGMSAEFLGGAAGIVLGILALLQVFPAVLLAVAAIVFGGVLVLGIGASSRLNALAIDRAWTGPEGEISRRTASEMVSASNAAQALVGLAGIILGILALVGIQYTLTLVLVALLCLGVSVMVSGTALSSKMMTVMHR
ncbi:MAG TPA: hypothetical protein VKU02_22840 [Gemmataceae bacterium]|nr:hypothetical protein [Gemmataceae bacterium]